MKIPSEYVLYTEEQVNGMVAVAVEDDNPDAPTVVQDEETGLLYAIVHQSLAIEEERRLRESFSIMRIDWLSVLGYQERSTELS